jgi:hypothetical protein
MNDRAGRTGFAPSPFFHCRNGDLAQDFDQVEFFVPGKIRSDDDGKKSLRRSF